MTKDHEEHPAGLSNTDSWFVVPENSTATLRLFCFPYSGGGANVFRRWSEGLPLEIEVWPVQLPGRGSRLLEKPINRLSPLVQAITQALLPYLDKPYAFFGHSMGALLSFELARNLRRHHLPGPLKLFVSAACAPQIPDTNPWIHALPEPEFLEELRRLNGTPRAVLENAELLQLLIPTLRADFAACETYVHEQEPPLDCPILAFGGLEDQSVSQECLQGWRDQSTSSLSVRMLPGGHFFLHTAESLVLRVLARELHELIQKGQIRT